MDVGWCNGGTMRLNQFHDKRSVYVCDTTPLSGFENLFEY